MDELGRTRLSAGDHGEGIYGLTLRDEQGRDRLVAGTGPAGVAVAFVLNGNEVLVVGIREPEPGADGPAFVHLDLADGEGDPLVAVGIGADGTLHFTAGL